MFKVQTVGCLDGLGDSPPLFIEVFLLNSGWVALFNAPLLEPLHNLPEQHLAVEERFEALLALVVLVAVHAEGGAAQKRLRRVLDVQH